MASLWFRDPRVHIDPGSFLERCILASSERCRAIAMQRRLMLYGRERELEDRLSFIRMRLEEFPGDAFLGDCQVETFAALTHLQEEKFEFTYHASVSSWS